MQKNTLNNLFSYFYPLKAFLKLRNLSYRVINIYCNCFALQFHLISLRTKIWATIFTMLLYTHTHIHNTHILRLRLKHCKIGHLLQDISSFCVEKIEILFFSYVLMREPYNGIQIKLNIDHHFLMDVRITNNFAELLEIDFAVLILFRTKEI